MKYLKNIIFSLGIVLATIFVFSFMLTLLSYLNIISNSLTTIFKMLIPII